LFAEYLQYVNNNMAKKKKISKLAKAKANPNSKYWRNKADKSWSLLIRRNNCFVCGTDQNLQAHHIIDRWVLQLRHEPLNGVSLCPAHHKWGRKVSGHKGAFGLAWLLQQKNPEQWEWLMSQFSNWDVITEQSTNFMEKHIELSNLLKENKDLL